MSYLHLAALAGLALFVFCFGKIQGTGNRTSRAGLWAAVLFLCALALRLAAAGCSRGFNTDTACFAAWADRMFDVGPAGFYSPDVFTDYPPGYMYLLYPVGALRKLLKLEYYSAPHLILLKLPSILCDLGCGWLIWNEGRKKCSASQALFLCGAYLFNPAVILNSSVWGQVDSILTLALACLCLSLVHGRLVPAYVSFFAAFLLKPQAVFLAPLLFAAMVDRLLLKGFSLVNLLRSLSFALLSLCSAVLLCAPFGLENVWNQYLSTIRSYPYASVNAYNFWALAGQNWVGQNNTFLGIPFFVWGYAAIGCAVLLTLWLCLSRHRKPENYPLAAAFLIVLLFVFSVRMHERYLYPAMLFLLLAYLYIPSGRLFFCYGGFSLLHFYNTAHVLYFYDPQNYDGHSPAILLTSLGLTGMACFLGGTVWELARSKEDALPRWDRPSPLAGRFLPRKTQKPVPTRRPLPLTAADWLCMAAITALYACFALYGLGDAKAPETAWEMTQGETVTLDFGEAAPASVSYYIAPWHDRVFSLEGKWKPEDAYSYLGDITLENVFTWKNISIQAGVPHLRLTLADSQASLLELVFQDADGKVLTPVNAGEYPQLFDEQELFPLRSSYRNSMYFDEIYHGRTAYEFLHGLTSYENTHPPLGKILIAAGIRLFGMNPFGWRIVGVLFGIAMVPVVYLFARRMTDSAPAAALACALFAFDFMHLAQTRIATIDVYITFFVILMYALMYRYRMFSFYDTPLWKTFLPLGACGVCMGFGIACKWTGIYAGAGLAVLFFSLLYRRLQEYRYAKADPEGSSNGIPHSRILSRFAPCTVKTILFCLCFFVLIPCLIYLLSYLPFRDYEGNGLIARTLKNQVTMFRYHSTLTATHPYSSPWYQWPVIARPIWYFSGQPGGTLREGISAFGNPLVWWTGIPAFLFMIRLAWKEQDQTAGFLLVGYLAQYLPWVFVSRITFIYHYFPSVAFVVLMIVHTMMRLARDKGKKQFLFTAALYGLAAFCLFVMFYPVLTGQPVETAYVDHWLRWFDSWVLTAK